MSRKLVTRRALQRQRQSDEERVIVGRMMKDAGLFAADGGCRVPYRIAQQLLLADKFFSHGVLVQFMARSVGGEMYEMTVERV